MAQGERALIVGARAGLGVALARRCAGEGMAVVLAARDTRNLEPLARETERPALLATPAAPRVSQGCSKLWTLAATGSTS
jgi:short-subunit dehydrogenase